MSVFDGDIEYKSIVMADYVKHNKPKNVRKKPADDNCLIVGLYHDALKSEDKPRRSHSVLCPTDYEYYKKAVDRFSEKYPDHVERYMRKEIDPTPVLNELQDLTRTEYLVQFCTRDLAFMSTNMARRARTLQTLRLPDDTPVPLSSQRASYRAPRDDCYERQPSMKPKFDDTCQNELRRLLRVRTGLSSYGNSYDLLGKVILEKQPFGPARAEPNFGKWRTPIGYTYWI